MKNSLFVKFLAATALIAAPVVVQARSGAREGAAIGVSEYAALGGLLAALLAASAVVGGAVALGGDDTPTSP